MPVELPFQNLQKASEAKHSPRLLRGVLAKTLVSLAVLGGMASDDQAAAKAIFA